MLHPKVKAASSVAVVVSVVVGLVRALGLDVPADVEGALVTLASFLAGYLKSA